MKAKEYKGRTTPNAMPVPERKNIKPQAKNAVKPAEPLPESSRPRKDGPGGE